MSNAQDRSPRDPRSDTAPSGTATAGDTASGPGATGAQGANSTRQYVPRPSPGYDDDRYAETGPSGAVIGLTVVAASLMMLSGAWNVLEGIAGIIRGQFFVVLPHYTYSFSATGWGWTHLIVGVVVFVAGACLLMDQTWARVAGVVIASLSAIANFLFIPYAPVWSFVVIALDIFVICALLTPRRGYS
jgi:hypothetical protein